MIASIQFLSEVNYLAVFVAALAYFILGALWYSVLFGKIWSKAVAETGRIISKPDSAKMMTMMVKSFLANLLCAFTVAYIVRLGWGYSVSTGIKLGLVCGCGFALSSLLMVANWQGTKTVVIIIDAGYQIFGILICSMIISCWH